MKKNYLLFFALLLFAGAVHAQTSTKIELVCDVTLPPGTEGLKATLNSYVTDDDLSIRHENPNYYMDRLRAQPGTLKSDATTVVIMGENDNVVFKKECNSSNICLMLNYLGIPSGKYALNIFWNDCWWRGHFDFKSHWPEGQYVYVDSTYYRLNKGYATTVWPDYYLGNDRTVSHRMSWTIFDRDYPLHVVIPSELTYEGEVYKVVGIEQRSFKYCHYLLSVSLPNTITYIEGAAFAECENLRRINIPESVTRIEGGAFDHCYNLSDIVIPEGIKTLEGGMFNHCTSISAVTLPSSLTRIEEMAFTHCFSLPYIEIPDNVMYIGKYAFQSCTSLMEMKLPKNLKQIDNYAFRGCERLTSIDVPETVTNIGDEAFKDMPGTAHIYCHARKPFTIHASTFNYNCTLHVPQGTKDLYEKAEYWKNFKVIEEEPTGEAVHGGETGVTSATLDAESAERFYDLQGRPVDGTQKGILIRNGKKVLIK